MDGAFYCIFLQVYSLGAAAYQSTTVFVRALIPAESLKAIRTV